MAINKIVEKKKKKDLYLSLPGHKSETATAKSAEGNIGNAKLKKKSNDT